MLKTKDRPKVSEQVAELLILIFKEQGRFKLSGADPEPVNNKNIDPRDNIALRL